MWNNYKRTVKDVFGWWSSVLDIFQHAFSFSRHHINHPHVGLTHSTHALEDSPLRSPLFAISHLLRSGRNLCATSIDCSCWREACAPPLKIIHAKEGRCLHIGLWSVKFLYDWLNLENNRPLKGRLAHPYKSLYISEYVREMELSKWINQLAELEEELL